MTGYLPEDFSIYGNMRMREAMDYLGALSGLDTRTRQARTAQLLARVGLEGEMDARVRKLSGGMLRRLGVAQALMHDPCVLLMEMCIRDRRVTGGLSALAGHEGGAEMTFALAE